MDVVITITSLQTVNILRLIYEREVMRNMDLYLNDEIGMNLFSNSV